MERKHFYILIALIWFFLLLRAYAGDIYFTASDDYNYRDPTDATLNKWSPILQYSQAMFWGIFSTAILYSIIDIEDDDEEE